MRRKLVKQGQNALTVTLPAKWLQSNNLTAGNEVDISIDLTGELTITPQLDKPIVVNRHTQDIEGIDSYQLRRLITGLYQTKTNEIVLNFKNTKIKDLRTGKTRTIEEVCTQMCQRLIGLEIINSNDHQITLQCFITREDEESIKTIEKRIFLLIKEFMKDIISNLDNSKNFQEFNKKVYSIHDNITKFCDYYIRIVTYSGISSLIKTRSFALISMLDKIIDKLRHMCNEINKLRKVSKGAKEGLVEIFDLFDLHYKYLYSIDKITSDVLVKERYRVIKKLQQEKYSIEDFRLFAEIYIILIMINDFYELKRVRDIKE